MDTDNDIKDTLEELQQLNLHSEFFKIAYKIISSIEILFFYVDKKHCNVEKQLEYLEIANTFLLLFENVYQENQDFVSLINRLKQKAQQRLNNRL